MSKRPCQSPCPGASEDKPADKKLRATIAPDGSAASSSSSTTERTVRIVANAGMQGFLAGECPKGYDYVGGGGGGGGGIAGGHVWE